jgi:hypothetical protein
MDAAVAKMPDAKPIEALTNFTKRGWGRRRKTVPLRQRSQIQEMSSSQGYGWLISVKE